MEICSKEIKTFHQRSDFCDCHNHHVWYCINCVELVVKEIVHNLCKTRASTNTGLCVVVKKGGKIMTANQIAYWQNQETQRSNLAREQETRRANMAQESETRRSNLAKEKENLRTNLANENIKILTLDETARSNRAREDETNRSNLAKEHENERSNRAKETETHRSNLVNERLTERGQNTKLLGDTVNGMGKIVSSFSW